MKDVKKRVEEIVRVFLVTVGLTELGTKLVKWRDECINGGKQALVHDGGWWI